jgi:hypothetical protein
VSSLLIAFLMIYPLVSAGQSLLALPQARASVGREEAAVLFIAEQLQEDDLILTSSPQDAAIWYYGRLHGIPDYHFDPTHPAQRVFLVTQPVKEQRVADLLERYGLTGEVWSSPIQLRERRELEIYLVARR